MFDDRRSPLSAAEAAVFVSGVASIGLEILAGRIVAPEFGNSIYTWGSIIAVFLGALGLGYHVGGKRAADRAELGAVVVLFSQAALFVAFLVLAGDTVLRIGDALPLPPRFAPLFPIAVLFGPLTYLLGFVSPYAAELSRADGKGSASGRVYALGTIGSLVGAFATTFFLVPAFPVGVVEAGFGFLLALSAFALALSAGDPDPGTVARALVALVVLVAAATVGNTGIARSGEVVYATDTAYQHLEIVDDDGVRTLYLDGAPQSATYLDREGYVWEYSRYLHLPLLLTEDVDRVLFIGGGGMTAPQRYLEEYENVTVDVVEIDPGVVAAAEQYFGVRESPRLNVYVADGREFLEETERTYDVIVLDAFRKDRVPFHLTTVEFMRLAADNLDSDGAFVANVISAPSGPGSAFFRAQYRTMRRAFEHVYAFPTGDGGFVQNIELVATVRERNFTQADLRDRARQRDLGVDLSEAIDQYHDAGDVPTGDAPILTDARGSVATLLDPQLGRRYVVTRTDNATTTAP